MKQIHMYKQFQNIETGKRSFIFSDCVDNKVTINKLFISKPLKEYETPFLEIKVVPPEEALKYEKLCREFKVSTLSQFKRQKKELDYEKAISLLFNFINDNWNSSKLNLFFASSGYDSRIVTSLAKKVHSKKGGNVLLVCMAPEIEEAKKVLEFQGWDLNLVKEYNGFIDENNLNFYKIHQHLNGFSEYPLNNFYCMFRKLVEEKIIDIDNTVVWTGWFGNEIFIPSPSLSKFLFRWYYSRIPKVTSIVHNVTMVFPMLSIEFLKEVFSSKKYLNDKIPRHKLVKTIGEDLFNIPRVDQKYQFNYQVAKEDLFEKLMNDYKNSYYYNNIDNEIIFNPVMRRNAIMWSKITIASLIEKLVKEGIAIKIKES